MPPKKKNTKSKEKLANPNDPSDSQHGSYSSEEIADSHNVKLKIPKLKRPEEFPEQEIRLKCIFQYKQLWDIVDPTSSKRSDQPDDDAKAEWDQMNVEAMILITDAVSYRSFIPLINHFKTA